MGSRLGGGNGHSRGLIDVQPVRPDCVLFTSNPQKPPPEGEMPLALGEVLQKWLAENPALRVRTTLPLTRGGQTIGLFVWFDRAG